MEKEKMSKIIGENKKSILEIKNCFKDGINEEVFRDLNNLQSL